MHRSQTQTSGLGPAEGVGEVLWFLTGNWALTLLPMKFERAWHS